MVEELKKEEETESEEVFSLVDDDMDLTDEELLEGAGGPAPESSAPSPSDDALVPAPDEAPEETKFQKEDPYKAIRSKFESNVDYTTVLSNFEGPLDLLLYLINREEIEIKDIFVSEVTEQFLDYMKGLPYLDVDKVTDYLNIAASIIKIKAQALVPNIEDDPEIEQEIEDDKAELIRALEEYRLIKEEMTKLKELETVGYYFKEPDKDVGETRTVFTLEGLDLDGLVKAFSAVLIRREHDLVDEEFREIPRDEYTVSQKITFILEVFEENKEVRFEELFTKDYTRSEIVTTFQALLELLKHQFLHVRQETAFGQIFITYNPEAKEAELGEIDEYN